MRTLVHLSSDDLIDQGEDDFTDTRRRLINRALACGVHLGVGGGDDAVVFGLSPTSRIGLHLIGRRLRGGHDLAGLVPRGGEEMLTFVARGGGFGLGRVGGGQRLADLLLTTLQRLVEGRQDVLRHQQQYHHHRHELNEERAVGKQKY